MVWMFCFFQYSSTPLLQYSNKLLIMIRPIITAFRTLTILPIPGKDTEHFPRSIPFFPFVGLLLGAIVYGVYKGAQLIGFDYSLIVAVIALVIITVLTGILHVDGLGDVADGFGSGKSRERILEIFKDSRMGAFGICAIVFDLLLKTFCWSELFKAGEIYVIIISLLFSRCAQSLFLISLPVAIETSILSRLSKSNIPIKISVLCVFILFVALGGYFVGYMHSILYAVSVVLVAILFSIYCMKKINGITGDCVGAVNELSEVAVLIAGLFLINT